MTFEEYKESWCQRDYKNAIFMIEEYINGDYYIGCRDQEGFDHYQAFRNWAGTRLPAFCPLELFEVLRKQS